MASSACYQCVVMATLVCGILAQGGLFRRYENGFPTNPPSGINDINMVVRPTPVPEVPNCPLEEHPDTETMFIMRGPLGDPEPRTCPPNTIFMRALCSCVSRPLDKCNLRPSAYGPGYYEEFVFGVWMQRPCGPGSLYNPATCDCSLSG